MHSNLFSAHFYSSYLFFELVVVNNAPVFCPCLVGIYRVHGIVEELRDLLAVSDAQTYQGEYPHL